MKPVATWVGLIGLIFSMGCHAKICAYIDEYGSLQVMQGARSAEGITFGASQCDLSQPAYRKHSEFDYLVSEVAREMDMDAQLLHVIVSVESSYNASAVSTRGAIGLMQVMPATGLRFGIKNIHDPRQNLRAGAAYLRHLMRIFKSDLSLALAAYNAGEGAVRRHGNKVPPYPETRNYIARVLAQYNARR